MAVGNSTVSDWISLLKPRVLVLVVYTGVIGLMIAPGHLTPLQSLIAIACITGAAGACGAINMWYDRDIDRLMRRTRNRPIAAGRVAPLGGLWFGVVLATISVLAMWAVVNWPAALALLFSACFYIFVYTMWLKRRTPQNIVIGGAAGALPPVIAWAAATGSIDATALVLFGIIFIWTPPHFWPLAIERRDEYAKADVPMLPVTHGVDFTTTQVLLYTLLLIAATVLPFAVGMSGLLYLLAALILGGVFLRYALLMKYAPRPGLPMRTFGYSIFYLMALFTAMLVDHYVATLL
jgi:protoheme IX farnesyltransferase